MAVTTIGSPIAPVRVIDAIVGPAAKPLVWARMMVWSGGVVVESAPVAPAVGPAVRATPETPTVWMPKSAAA